MDNYEERIKHYIYIYIQYSVKIFFDNSVADYIALLCISIA